MNQTWKDKDGRQWSTTFRSIDAVRLRESAGFDLLNPKSMEKLFGSELTDSLKRAEVIAELNRRQWEQAGLSYEQFADALFSTETSFVEASAALQASIAYFFRQLGRVDMATVCDRAWQMMVAQLKALEAKAGSEKVGKLLEVAAAKGIQAVDRELDQALANLGTPSGDLSGSTAATGAS